MIGYIFIILMGFFNACMDAFENENYFESIFKNWDQRFWYKRESWKYARKLGGYKFDAWHISKTLWVGSFIMAVVSAILWPFVGSWYVVVANMIILYNVSFILFYHYVFGVK
jgi:hypothetical protein